MKLAFCTAIEPSWDLPGVTAKARDLGYEGIEVHLPNPTVGDPAAGTPLVERELVRLAFEQASVQLACIAAPICFTGDRCSDEKNGDALRGVIDLAARVKCVKVRISDMAVRPRVPTAVAALELADWLAPLADHAAGAGVTLLVQNALTFRTAWDLWRVIEQANHPSLAVAWDALSAALAGEAPSVSIPLLNSRIRHVLLRDALLTGESPSRTVGPFRRLGEGELEPGKLLNRLRGIGYRGWVSVAYPPAGADANLGSPEELLRHAMAQVKACEPKPPKPHVAKKAAAGQARV